MTLAASRRTVLSTGIATIAFPMVNFGCFRLAAEPLRTYSRRAVDLVHSTLVIDMLGPLTLDLSPENYAKPLSDKGIADFKASGITGFHHSFGIGGPDARTEVLTFLAGWQGFAGRHPDLFAVIGSGADLDHAKATGGSMSSWASRMPITSAPLPTSPPSTTLASAAHS